MRYVIKFLTLPIPLWMIRGSRILAYLEAEAALKV